MWISRLCSAISLSRIILKRFYNPNCSSVFASNTLPVCSMHAMFSSSPAHNSDSDNVEYSNPVPKILSKCQHGIQAKKKYRDALILEGVKFYLDKGYFKESADFFSDQVELYHSTKGLHLLLDFCLRSYKEEVRHMKVVKKVEDGEENIEVKEFKSAQKICRHRVLRIREICFKRLNTNTFIACLIASMIFNGFYNDALLFMLSVGSGWLSIEKDLVFVPKVMDYVFQFSPKANAFCESLFLWKRQCELKSMERFAELLEKAYFGCLEQTIDQKEMEPIKFNCKEKKKKASASEIEASKAVTEETAKKDKEGDASESKTKKASEESKMISYCANIELNFLLEIWKQNHRHKNTRVCVKLHKLNVVKLAEMINVFVDSWARIAVRQQNKDSLMKLQAFLDRNNIKLSDKNNKRLQGIMAIYSKQQM